MSLESNLKLWNTSAIMEDEDRPMYSITGTSPTLEISSSSSPCNGYLTTIGDSDDHSMTEYDSSSNDSFSGESEEEKPPQSETTLSCDNDRRDKDRLKNEKYQRRNEKRAQDLHEGYLHLMQSSPPDSVARALLGSDLLSALEANSPPSQGMSPWIFAEKGLSILPESSSQSGWNARGSLDYASIDWSLDMSRSSSSMNHDLMSGSWWIMPMDGDVASLPTSSSPSLIDDSSEIYFSIGGHLDGSSDSDGSPEWRSPFDERDLSRLQGSLWHPLP